VINKADGENKPRAERARVEYTAALRLFPPGADGWTPRVLACSSLHNQGIAEVWDMVRQHRAHQVDGGNFQRRRNRQALDWMRELISLGLQEMFHSDSAVQARMPALQAAVEVGDVTSFRAARELLTLFREGH
jgi:LAO/AO transport system kinase